MMKFLTAILMAALLGGGAAAAPQTAAQNQTFTLSGLILSIEEEGVLLDRGEEGQVLALVDEDTLIEGVEAELAVGQYALVDYDGKMTRSLPPQVYAQRVAVYALRGVVTQMEGQSAMVGTDEYGQVQVHLPQGTTLFVGCPVTVYFDGAMTASLPAQVSALYVLTPTVTGSVTEVDEDAFLIQDPDGQIWQVNRAPDTVYEAQVQVGAQVTVYFSGASTYSIPPQISAIALTPMLAAQ